MKEKAIILSRVSSLHQDLNQQTDAVLKEVKRNGFCENDIIIIEDKESAIKLSEEERNGLNKLKEYIKNDPSITTVYLYELSRLSRRQLVLFSIRDFLIERKIQLVCLNPYFRLLENDGKMSQTGSIIFSLFSSISESEMMLKKERLLRGRYRNKQIGKTMGGRPTFGYYIDKQKYYRVDPQQSDILKRIFSDYINGKKMLQIAKALKEEGIFPNCTDHTLFAKIDRWLKADYLIGNTQYPQIISKTMFEKAQKVRAQHKNLPRKSHKNIFLLKGLIFDANNKKPLWAQSIPQTYTDTHYNGCSIHRNNVEPIVWEIAKRLYQKHIMNTVIYKRQLQKDIFTIGKKIETVKSEIDNLKKMIDRTEERMIYGKLSEGRGEEIVVRLSEELSDKDCRLLELVNEMAAKQQLLIDADYLGTFNEEQLSLDDKIEIVRKTIKKVMVKRVQKRIAQITVFNHLNNIVSVFEVNCRTAEYKKIDEYNRKEKRQSETD